MCLVLSGEVFKLMIFYLLLHAAVTYLILCNVLFWLVFRHQQASSQTNVYLDSKALRFFFSSSLRRMPENSQNELQGNISWLFR